MALVPKVTKVLAEKQGGKFVIVLKLTVYNTKVITGITQANPGVLTYSGGDALLQDGGQVIIEDVVGMTELNNNSIVIANLNTANNTFELNGVDTTLFAPYVSGGIIKIEVISGNFQSIFDKSNGDTVALVQERFRKMMQNAIDEYKRPEPDPDPGDLNNVLTDLANSLVL